MMVNRRKGWLGGLSSTSNATQLCYGKTPPALLFKDFVLVATGKATVSAGISGIALVKVLSGNHNRWSSHRLLTEDPSGARLRCVWLTQPRGNASCCGHLPLKQTFKKVNLCIFVAIYVVMKVVASCLRTQCCDSLVFRKDEVCKECGRLHTLG